MQTWVSNISQPVGVKKILHKYRTRSYVLQLNKSVYVSSRLNLNFVYCNVQYIRHIKVASVSQFFKAWEDEPNCKYEIPVRPARARNNGRSPVNDQPKTSQLFSLNGQICKTAVTVILYCTMAILYKPILWLWLWKHTWYMIYDTNELYNVNNWTFVSFKNSATLTAIVLLCRMVFYTVMCTGKYGIFFGFHKKWTWCSL